MQRAAEVFQPATVKLRREVDSLYLKFLTERNGGLDGTGRLPKKEARLRLELLEPGNAESPPPDRGAVDLLTRVSDGESFVVDMLDSQDPNPVMAYVVREEGYHVRILEGLSRRLGGRAKAQRPPRLFSAMLRALVRWPSFITTPFLFCGELVSVVLFIAIRRGLNESLSPEDPRREAVNRLLTELLVDEVGHLAYQHAQLGPVGLFVARLVIQVIGRVVAWREPFVREFVRANVFRPRWSDLPPEVLAAAFVPAYSAACGYSLREPTRRLSGGADSPAAR